MQENRQSGYGFMGLVSGILDDARTLLRQEAQLLKDEIKLELSKAGRAASGFGIGAGLAAVGALFLLLMLVHGLHEWLSWPLWICYGLVGAAITLEGRATGGSSFTCASGLPGAFFAISSRRPRHSGSAAMTASPNMS